MSGLVNGGMVNRGHSLVSGGLIRAASPSTPVLYQNLVGAWELTSGSLDSGTNGLHLTEINGPSLTYDSNGVQGNGVAYLSHANNSLFDAGMDKDFFICVSFKTSSNEGVLVGKTQNGEAPFYDEYCVSFDGLNRFRCYMYNDTVNAGSPSIDTFHVGFAWFNHTTGRLSVQIDDGLPVSSVIGGNPSNNSSPFTLLATDDGNSGYAGNSRNTVLWVGDDLSAQYQTSARTYLYNSGAGRTYAAMAGYVP